ncbi:MAG: S41 family peptidase [Alistipes sp.]|nr:S41 family peptidase [Alistipes sp.]MBR3911904.1 S41 family peptidase [Alistipes sp.]
MKSVKRYGLVALVVAAVATGVWATRDDFGLGRNMEIMVNLMREITLQYVDDVDTDKLMQDGALGMVRNLDPYTTYMSEKEMDSFEVQATGKYGGIGSTIRMKRDSSGVVIAQPYKNSPADLAGLKIGDKFVSIDGEDVTKCTTEQISSRLKGTPGTKVKLAVKRLMTGKVEEMEIERARIAIPGVPYAGFVADGIGYIRHDDFTDGCYDDMRAEVERLRETGELKGLILDYRDNGGGSVAEAVKILSMFVPKGSKVLTMKGRAESSTRTYTTDSNPVLGELPLVALINGNTASASEIVCGALQDMDRAVLMGQRSYGKGLVQTLVPLGYNAYAKITTSKYYIPSGRCVQRINYSHSGGKDENVPDSLINEFRTSAGRKVYDGKGLMPDIKVAPDYISTFAVMLYNLGYIEDFLDEYMRRNPSLKVDNKNFTITDADYEDFVKFMADKDVPYESQTRMALELLQKTSKEERYDSDFADDLKQIESKLKDQKMDNLRNYRAEIMDLINGDVVLRHNYYQGVVEHNLVSDSTVMKAIDVLRDGERYSKILSEQDTEKN